MFISLGPTDVTNAVPDKPNVHLVLKGGERRFARGGFAHFTRNLSDAPLRLVAIEFLRPQGEPHNLCDQVVDGPVNDSSPNVGKLPPDSPLRSLPQLGIIPRRVFKTDEVEVSSFSISLVGSYNEDSKSAKSLVAEDGPPVHVEIAREPLAPSTAATLCGLKLEKNGRSSFRGKESRHGL
jgi:hypothetical protein